MLAYHYSKSEHLEKSYKYLRLSGMKAADSYANQDAFRLFKETLEILNLQPQTAETKRNKIEIQRLLCNILLFLGYPQDSLQILQEGDQLANELGDRKSIAIFNLHLANIYNNKGDTLLAVKHAENSIAEAEKVSDIDVMVQMTSLLVMAYNITGNSKKVVAVAEKLIDIIEENNRKDDMFGLPLNPYSFACACCGAHSGYLGNFKKHKTYCEKGLQHAVKTGDPIGIGFNEMVYGHYYLGKGNFSKTVEHLLTSIKYAEKINWPFALSHFSCHLGYTYSLMGEKENAIQNLEKGLKIQTDLGILSMLSTLYAYSSMAYYTLNRFKHARKFAEKAIKLSQKHNEIRIEGLSKIYLGAILAKSEQNQNEQAENYIFEGIKILEELEQMPTYSQGYFFLGKLYLERGRKEKALSNLHKAENIFKEMGMDYWLYKTQKVLKKLRNYNADAHIV
jgi:tetratricopeptide (TPR) repeat protein